MRTDLRILFIFLLGIAFHISYIHAAQLPPGYAEEVIIDGVDPTRMAIAPDGRIFIAQKNGIVSIVRNGELLPDPFLEIEVDNWNERGLTGMVLDPEFDKNGYVYLYYTVLNDNRNRVSRFTANGDFVVPGSELVILEMEELGGTIHNGGDMVFANDGSLFIAIGDGTYGHLPQDPNSLFGKVVRIYPDGTIPLDNPFYDEFEGISKSIYAIGFRNPFTIDYDPVREILYANDVGGSDWEEIIDIKAGMNYGWPIVEGPFVSGEKPDNYRDAVFNYPHSNGYCAIIGAAFYNPEGSNFDEKYFGKYFFGDYCKGDIRVWDPETGTIQERFATNIDRPISIKVAPNGDLYYIARGGIGGGSQVDNTSSQNGKLYRVYYIGDGTPFVVNDPKDVLVSVGEDASFSVEAGGQGTLEYQWYLNDNIIPDANEPQLTVTNTELTDDGNLYACEISINGTTVRSGAAQLSVTSNRRPEITIETPIVNSDYQAGTMINFNGFATDTEDGAIPDFNLTWKIDFHHDDHTHPIFDIISGANGSVNIPTTGELSTNVWYRFYLTATDSEGLSNTEFVDVYPDQASFEVNTIPEGLKVSVDGKSEITPNTTFSVIGMIRNLKAPLLQRLNGKNYVFSHWEDGSVQSVTSFIKSESTESFTAIYEEVEELTGTGLLGIYQNTEPGTTDPIGEVHYQIDTIVNFDWAEGSPIPGTIVENNFRVTWRGRITPIVDDNYYFYARIDDGVRVKIDGDLIIDEWSNGALREFSNRKFLEGGVSYPIEVEYYEAGGAATVYLSWAGTTFPKGIIPKKHLTPDPIPGTLANEILPEVKNNNGSIQLSIKSEISTPVNWAVYDNSGKLIHADRTEVIPGSNPVPYSVENLPSGLYFFRVNLDDADVLTSKFVK